MRSKKIIALLLLLLMCLMTACGDKAEKEEPEVPQVKDETALVPNAYFIGSQSIIAVQPEAGVELTKLETAEDGTYIYTYAGFAQVNQSVQNYVATLTSAEHGFAIVDSETFRYTAAPDYTLGEGSMSLSKPAEDGMITVIRLDWFEDQCIASISMEIAPIVEDTEEDTDNENFGFTHDEAINYLRKLAPTAFDLEGDSMAEYNIHIMNGLTYVDGKACLRVKIYAVNEKTGTNVYMGTFFMSENGEHIYRVGEDGLAVEINQNKR